jgi:hypothetical protein
MLAEDFTEEDRQLFLKFVTGKSRMNSGHFYFNIVWQGMDTSDPLPKTHTCYNMIDLPGYSSKEAMTKAMLIASRFCQSIDDD